MKETMWAWAAEKDAAGQRIAFISVSATSGSSPASPGQVMLVAEDGSSFGTVGGGTSEHEVLCQAVEAIKNGDKIFEFSVVHAEKGMTCGGSFKGQGTILGDQFNLVVFGGGHIAQSLVPLATRTGFRVFVVEDRSEFAEYFTDATFAVIDAPDYESKLKLPANAFVVICTRGHTHDLDALRFVLKKKRVQAIQYVGMLGSSKKVASIKAQMLDEGFSKEEFETVHTPIGLDIASGLPAEIAVSILAEILLVKNKGSARHKSDR